jgi:acyl-CoA oxidase
MRYREEELLVNVARRLKGRIDRGMSLFDAFNECQDHLVTLAHAHVERVILELFLETIEDCPDPVAAETLTMLRNLFALSRIEADRGWFLESGYIEKNKAKAIRKQVNLLCADARRQAVPLVDSFGIPDELLGAPIAMRR